MKFVVGYLSVIGLILFPWFGKLIALIYLCFLWSRWKNFKLVLLIGVSSFLSYFLFGIIFAYSFPVWIALGVVFFLYGCMIGLFKKTNEESNEKHHNDSKPKKSSASLKAKVLSTLFLVGSIGGIIWVLNYGFNNRPCEYTFDHFNISSTLIDRKVILIKNAYVAKGLAPDFCKFSEYQISNQIVHSKTINNYSVGKGYYEKQGRAIEKLEKGKIFDFVAVIAKTRHGIGSMFTSSPSFFLLLKDKSGVEYRIYISSLGFDADEAILSYFPESNETGKISWKFFRTYL